LIGWVSRASFLCALALAIVLACAPALGAERRPDKRVSVNDNYFSARSLTVKVGDLVRWTWRGDNRHNVTFKKVPKGAGKRGAQTRSDGHWQRRFRVAGQYRYFCTLYAGMRGTITVEPAAEPSGAASVGAPGQ
jgi:plastocyanin